ncbi:fumarylacetoacetase [Asticcacaulis sp. AC460]|uniref:fumarylacetoacetase n=1 Tax=Asticcacaulis sp. AC460 TaxID=1282360 RepID=UPI0003C400AA|nr:fumarylacetoacetase [Asticcacaulis sp. AC460]ESQ93303.1 fumarylacetoacetase [Asticcacaulis sp. AC460]
MIDETHNPNLTSWVADANGHNDFPIQNLPFGLFSPADEAPRPGVAIGDHIIELEALAEAGLIGEAPRDLADVLGTPALRKTLRRQMSKLLSDPQYRAVAQAYLYRAADCTLHLPVRVGDYTDFYVGIHHASAVGALFRPDNPLLPNYKHVPIGYHGRASSIRPSGVAVVRPHGQTKPADSDVPVYGPCKRLDFELELGLWIGGGNDLGRPIPLDEAQAHIAGLCLLNDWSARDVQAWEYQPLGPFLAKNFHSTVSPWVVTAEALEPFRVPALPRPDGDPEPLPYLRGETTVYDVALEVHIQTAAMRDQGLAPHVLSRSSARDAMYWTPAQIVTHHASNGCNLTTGDLLGTGTLSGPQPDQAGSLLELSHGGKVPVDLPSGEMRRFLEDGDEVWLAGRCTADGFVSIGFGACRARVTG